ncbi:MAG: eCIS core domain-containing protein [Thermoanaerobaculia bacterium]
MTLAKLTIHQPGDESEQEADRVSKQVTQDAPARLQHMSASDEVGSQIQTNQSEQRTRIQTSRVQSSGTGRSVPPTVRDVLRSPGKPMDVANRAFMESRFGHDFARVRVHSGTAAEQSAKDVNAHAYTVGHDIVFGPRRFAPATHEGQRLLAHELTHVLQQTGAAGALAVAGSLQREAVGVGETENATGSGAEGDPEYWLSHSPNVTRMSTTELYDRVDEIQDWLDRQNATSPESMQLQGIRDEFVEEAVTRGRRSGEAERAAPKRTRSSLSRKQGKGKPASRSQEADVPEKPRILRERTSAEITDTVTLRRDYDEIMAYLQRTDIPADEREVLQAELANLTPALADDLQVRAGERRNRFVLDTFERASGGNLADFAGALDRVKPLRDRPGHSYLMVGQELVVLSDEEVASVRGSFRRNVLLREERRLENTQRLTGEGEEAIVQFRRHLEGASKGTGSYRDALLWLQEADEHLEDEEAAEARWGGIGSLLGYHAKRFATGAISTIKNAVTEPFKQVHDLTLIGLHELGMDVSEEDMISNTAEAYRQGESGARLILSSNPLTSPGVMTYDMTRAGIEGRWGDLSEQAGGVAGGWVFGKVIAGRPGKSGSGGRLRNRIERIPDAIARGLDESLPGAHAGAEVTTSRSPMIDSSVPGRPGAYAGAEVTTSRSPMIDSSAPGGPGVRAKVGQTRVPLDPSITPSIDTIPTVVAPKAPAATAPRPPRPRETRPSSPDAARPARPKSSPDYSAPLDKRIADARAELNAAKQRTVEYKRGRADAGENQSGGLAKGMWNEMENLHLLERARARPDVSVLGQARLVGVRNADGTITPAARIAGKGRIPDFLEWDGVKALGGEAKSQAEIIRSVKDLHSPEKVGDFKAGSNVGKQRTKEATIVDEAIARKGVLVFEGTDIRTGVARTIDVHPDNYSSTVVSYDQIQPN